MIDNFDLMLDILPEKPVDDLTYYVQITKRKKDHPGLEGKNNSARLVKPYYVTCQSDLLKRKEEMILLAEATGARIMMDAFPKHRDKVKYEMMIRLAEIIRDGNDAKLHRLYNSTYGSMAPSKGKGLWLIDWDYKDTTDLDDAIRKYNADIACKGKGDCMIKIEHIIPTRQGFHYLIKPCNLEPFSRFFNNKYGHCPDVHKTSPTLVYIPKCLEKYENSNI